MLTIRLIYVKHIIVILFFLESSTTFYYNTRLCDHQVTSCDKYMTVTYHVILTLILSLKIREQIENKIKNEKNKLSLSFVISTIWLYYDVLVTGHGRK